MSLGLYVHIPYCLSKCRYCDFYSLGGSRQVPDAYIDALLAEWHRAKNTFHLGQPDTLYFGGGTPSLMSPAQAARLIDAFSPLSGAEITLEANPETVTPESLRAFRKAGVNRLSIGVQTARDDSLKRLGRPHTAQQARTALEAAHAAGFENLSGDIMMALPNYSRDEFDETMKLIAESGAVHISAYLLKIEEGTPFGLHPPAGLPTEDESADFYLYAVDQLEKAGFAQYEISNFARPGYEGRHNLIYWNCENYLGLGPAAHSCIQNRRFYYANHLADFMHGQCTLKEEGVCDVSDYIILQLRLRSGLNLKKLKKLYGVVFSPRQMKFIEQCFCAGYAALQGDVLTLTPTGLIIQNSILCELLEK